MRLRQVVLVVFGLYACLAATIAHRHTVAVDNIDLPLGLLLALIGAYSIARAVDPWAGLGSAYFALGWAIGLTLPMLPPGGSYLIAEDWLGVTFMLGSVGGLALAVVRGSRTPRLIP